MSRSHRKQEGLEHEFEVFYDGKCPLCKREINWLKKKDKQNRIRFTDISEENFDAAFFGKTERDFMMTIQGRVLDQDENRWVSGVEVFRQIYSRVGFSWLVSVSRLPILRHVMSGIYVIFAKLRFLHASRRCGEQCSVKLN